MMKKLLLFGLLAAGAAAVGTVIYKAAKGKQCECIGSDEDCGDFCCDDECCEDGICDIPAEKAEDQGIITDACACGCEEESLADIEDKVESDDL